MEKLGPHRGRLARAIAAISSPADLVEVLGAMARHEVGGAFGVYVNTDDQRSDRYVVYLDQGGIGLPDEAYYREDALRRDARRRTSPTSRRCSACSAMTTTRPTAGRIMALETRLAAGHWDKVASRDVRQVLQPDDATTNCAAPPRLRLGAWVAGIGGARRARSPRSSSASRATSRRCPRRSTTSRSTTGRTGSRFHLVRAAAPYLSTAFVEENFDFYGRTLTGAAGDAAALEARRRARRAAAGRGGRRGVRRQALPAGGQGADGRRWSPTCIEAYRRNIDRLDWMSPETRSEGAGEARRSSGPRSATPTSGATTPRLEIRPRRPGRQRARAPTPFETDRQLAKLGKPGRPRRVADDAADGQRLLQPRHERDRASRRRSCGRRSSTPRPTRRSTTAASAR